MLGAAAASQQTQVESTVVGGAAEPDKLAVFAPDCLIGVGVADQDWRWIRDVRQVQRVARVRLQPAAIAAERMLMRRDEQQPLAIGRWRLKKRVEGWDRAQRRNLEQLFGRADDASEDRMNPAKKRTTRMPSDL